MAALVAAGAAGSATLPGGTSIAVTIGAPADGATFDYGAAIPLSGTATVGEGVSTPRTAMIYALDVSGSTTTAVTNGVANCGDAATGGPVGSVLDCEVKSLVDLDEQAVTNGTVAEVGAVAFATTAVIGDVGPASGSQPLTGPATDGNADQVPDIETVLHSAHTASLPIGFAQFTSVSASNTGTNYQDAIAKIGQLLSQTTSANRIVVMVSDGFADQGTPMAPQQFATWVQTHAPGATFYTFAVGTSAQCSPAWNGYGTLQAIADATGSPACQHISDPAQLPAVVPGLVGSSLTAVTLSVDGGSPVPAASITPSLPQTGPASVSWSDSVMGLLPGGHVICATASGTDEGGTGDTQTCINIHVRSVDAGGPYGSGGGNTSYEGDAVPIAATTLGGATFDHWSYAPGAGVDPGATCSFADPSAASTTVTCTDDGSFTLTAHTTGPNGSAEAKLTLDNSSPALATPTFSPSGTVLTGTNVTVSGAFTDAGINDTHTCTLTWSDSTVQSGAATETPGSGSGSCTFQRPLTTGSYTASLTVTDDNGGSDTKAVGGGAGISIDVVDHAVDPGGPYGAKPGGGSYTEGEAVPVSATVVSGATFAGWTYAPDAGVDPGATCSFADAAAASTTVTCTDDGSYTLTAATTGPTDSRSTSLTLVNASPTVGPIAFAPGAVALAGSITATAPFTDAGVNDTHTCTVQWDSTLAALPATVVETPQSGSGTCSGTTTLAPGVYTVTVAVTDDDGGTGSTTASQSLVVYDPSAGFLTGGGWIDVAPGSYAPDPTVTGKATFGFVARYQSGAATPTGNAQFHLGGPGLDFSSDGYRWLVVAGAGAQLEGTGSLNGTPGYGFRVTAVDGQMAGGGGTDAFRIRIWDAHGTVILDTRSGAPEGLTAADAQAVAGGSIVIHQ